MCGRFTVKGKKLSEQVSEELGCDFEADANEDLCPTQQVETLISSEGKLQQLSTTWGIHPQWSNKLLINAKAETVTGKSTFRQAFTHRRCVVPCSGWFEWRNEGGSRKRKYFFRQEYESALYMAGFWYPGADTHLPQLMTMTTAPTATCAEYHHRMPLLIQAEHIHYWLNAKPDELQPLLTSPDEAILISPAETPKPSPSTGQQSLF